MLVPPTKLSEFLVYRASFSTDYEVFVFPGSIKPILDGYEHGAPIDEKFSQDVKSYIFEDIDQFVCRDKLGAWLKQVGVRQYEQAVATCSAWRLIHIIVPDYFYPPRYQDHPVRTEAWRRMPQVIPKKQQKSKGDIFDPLSYVVDPTTGSPYFDQM